MGAVIRLIALLGDESYDDRGRRQSMELHAASMTPTESSQTGIAFDAVGHSLFRTSRADRTL